jgi:hypothetical protein
MYGLNNLNHPKYNSSKLPNIEKEKYYNSKTLLKFFIPLLCNLIIKNYEKFVIRWGLINRVRVQ